LPNTYLFIRCIISNTGSYLFEFCLLNAREFVLTFLYCWLCIGGKWSCTLVNAVCYFVSQRIVVTPVVSRVKVLTSLLVLIVYASVIILNKSDTI